MKYLIIVFLLATLFGCGDAPKQEAQATSPGIKSAKQINLTILLDLSDRIDPKLSPAVPSHLERDSMLMGFFARYFLNQMEDRGSFMAKGKMRVIFHPAPADAGINQAVKHLNVDLSKMDTKGKKQVYDNLQHIVSENISHIYRTAVGQTVWPGSDIWRFFKNDVNEIAIDEDTSYRNVLVIFTDGYLYHQASKDVEGNRYAYLLPELFDKYRFRGNPNWAAEMDKLDFGLISKRSDLERLEVLVLEVAPSSKNSNDEDFIRKVMEKWFSEMKVGKWKVVNSDLPELTIKKVATFLKN